MVTARSAAACGLAVLLTWTAGAAPAAGQAADSSSAWDVTLARGETREIDFTTEEGTFMSVDVSPDGQWLVFDLLAHIYRMPITGGDATVLTQNSGVALNSHPRISPDGRHIAFVSDRRGQSNLWIMDADGSNPRQVFNDLYVRVVEPTWTPDGEYVLVRRSQLARPGSTGGGGGGIWMYHRDGGEGIELVGSDVSGAAWPSISSDGRFIYFQVATSERGDLLRGALQLRRLEVATGEIIEITAGENQQQLRLSSGGAFAPEISPDGRWLAFARRIPDGRISYAGHELGPRTALWLRDLETGAERVVMDPIEFDVAEGMKVLRALPGYDWMPDGNSVVLTQGGRFRRLDVQTGEVTTIPFRARVQRTLSQQAYAPMRIDDDPLQVRFVRWHTASPDGRTLAFQAVGRVWLMDLPAGTPRPLTGARAVPVQNQGSDDGADATLQEPPFEFAPAWSPDGRWIAYTTWDDLEGGHIWRAPAAGGAPERLTGTPGEYVNPAWTPDGSEILAARGAGVTRHNRGLVHSPWYDIVALPAAGGDAELVTKVTLPSGSSFFSVSRSQIVRPTAATDGRIYFAQLVSEDPQDRMALVSVRRDGSDRRVHMTLPYGDEMVPSPDGRRVAFNEGDNIHVVPLPATGTAAEPLHIDKRRGRVPVEKLSAEGGMFPHWRSEGIVEFGSGPSYFAHDVASGTTDTVSIDLRVPRAIAGGTIALTNARIITLEDREVIENGTIVVRDGRVACVGSCEVGGADHVVDATGRTIIPGFVDMHSHHFREYRGIVPRRAFEAAVVLAFGVTTSMDNSMWSHDVFSTAELIEAGEVIGPRAFSTGDPLYAGDRGRQNDLSSFEVTQQNVNRLASWGAVSIKQYMQPRRDQRQWVSEAARRHGGVMVTGEGGDLEYNLGTTMDGQTGWEHPMSYAPLYSDATRFFGMAGAHYSATLVVGGPGPWNEEFFFGESDVWKNEKLRNWLPWQQLVPHTRRRVLRPETDYSFPILAQGVADVIEHGGWGAIGSHGQQHGLASHWEVWMLASALGPMGALEVASLHGAHFLGADRDIGSIRTGKLADLLVLNSNPLDDIRNTLDIMYVMKAGRLYDDETLDEIWPTPRPYGPRPWINPDALVDDVRPLDYWDRRR